MNLGLNLLLILCSYSHMYGDVNCSELFKFFFQQFSLNVVIIQFGYEEFPDECFSLISEITNIEQFVNFTVKVFD